MVTVVSPSLVGTPFADLTSVELDVTRIDILHRTDCNDPRTEQVRTEPVSLTANLTTASPNVARPISVQIPVGAGCVKQVSFIESAMRITRGGTTFPVTVPNGHEKGLRLVPAHGTAPFPVLALPSSMRTTCR
jgi:hypothetical protein